MRENENTVDQKTAIQWAKDAGGQFMTSHHISVPDWIEINPGKLQTLVNRAVDHGRQQADSSELVDALKRSRVEIMAFAKSCGFGLMTESVIHKIDAALLKHRVTNDN